ncbi:MAG TPA: SEC59/DGK1/VTE5 family protein [Spirochaetota bacterium]|nr:SEC59/DGK1/VTE5 family protein [Spirochaetota bacterium]HOM37761.1 SEC59/DGK1/VTE5 family protein [Spirochaetota bacterium]HPQ49362.1 SEC59/DGK1/VTE5 family protein [Spirochaetota bacterium]
MEYNQEGRHRGDIGNIKTKKYELKVLRKLLHSTIGIIAILFYFFPLYENIFIFILSSVIILTLIVDVIRLTFTHINDFFFKYFHFLFVERDKNKINSANFYFMGCLLTLMFFPSSIAAIGILYLSFGDTSAAIIGQKLSKKISIKIPKTNKTFIGSIGFVVVSTIIGITFGLNIKTALLSAVVGAIFEALPLGIDDNFTIPFFSSLTIWAMSI